MAIAMGHYPDKAGVSLCAVNLTGGTSVSSSAHCWQMECRCLRWALLSLPHAKAAKMAKATALLEEASVPCVLLDETNISALCLHIPLASQTFGKNRTSGMKWSDSYFFPLVLHISHTDMLNYLCAIHIF